MGHLGDVLPALLTADAVLTDVTQWSSFPRASCFSLVAHTVATDHGSGSHNNGDVNLIIPANFYTE